MSDTDAEDGEEAELVSDTDAEDWEEGQLVSWEKVELSEDFVGIVLCVCQIVGIVIGLFACIFLFFTHTD